METGTVQWFDPKKGYGFIRSETIKDDIFVHHRAILGSGFRRLKTRQQVVFELEHNERGFIAKSVIPI